MRQIIRSFSIGLFTAGIIMLAVYFIGGGTESAEDMELEELIPLVEEKGHRVVTEEEYITLAVQSSDSDKEENNEEEKQEEKDEASDEKDQPKKEENADDEDQTNENKNEEEADRDDEEESEGESEETEEESDEPSDFTIHISSGMASSEISAVLEENNIIDDASEFTDYLEEHDYSIQVKAGAHSVSSDMSFYELAMELISN